MDISLAHEHLQHKCPHKLLGFYLVNADPSILYNISMNVYVRTYILEKFLVHFLVTNAENIKLLADKRTVRDRINLSHVINIDLGREFAQP